MKPVLSHFYLFAITVLFAICTAGMVTAAITGTEVSAGMKIAMDGEAEIVETDSSSEFASAGFRDPTSGAIVSSLLHINSLSEEEVNLNFHILLDANNTSMTGYLGQADDRINHAYITYHADVDSRVDYSWDFDYTGSHPSGLLKMLMWNSISPITQIGDSFGQIPHHEGTETLTLLAGNSYTFRVAFVPNASGNIAAVEGTMAGDVSFTFTPIPEPATMCLLGLGGVLLRRRS